jgi:hypothetical protein
MTRISCAIALLACFLTACSNDKKSPTEGEGRPPARAATTPEIVMDNIERAFEERDAGLYVILLAERFWFNEPGCAGIITFFNGREEELEIIVGRDNSDGLGGLFRTIEYTFSLLQNGRTRELGVNHPNAFENDPDGHPDEDWEVFRGRVEMLLLTTPEDGFRVDQLMTFKIRQDNDGLWRLVRWIDDSLDNSGDACGGSAKLTTEATSWGLVKTIIGQS